MIWIIRIIIGVVFFGILISSGIGGFEALLTSVGAAFGIPFLFKKIKEIHYENERKRKKEIENEEKEEEKQAELRKKQREGYAADFQKKSRDVIRQVEGKIQVIDNVKLPPDFKAVGLQEKLWIELNKASMALQKLDDTVTELNEKKGKANENF